MSVTKYKSSRKYNNDKKKKKRSMKLFTDDKKKKKRTMKSTTDNKKKKKRRTSSTSQDDKKKKKRRKSKTSQDDKKKKKKKHISQDKINILPVIKDSMKDAICNKKKDIDFVDIDVSDKTTYWGLGIEHEMQLFHKASSGMKNTNIIFNSQESTCFLTNEHDSCCKIKVKCNDFTKEASKYKIKDFGLTEEEKRFIENTTWELSGRQVNNCEKGKETTWLSKRVPILMPEIISTNFANRTIDSIWKEIIKLEDHYVAIQMKNPHTKQKVQKYGPLTTHL